MTQEWFDDGKGKLAALPCGGGDLRWCSGREIERDREGGEENRGGGRKQRRVLPGFRERAESLERDFGI